MSGLVASVVVEPAIAIQLELPALDSVAEIVGFALAAGLVTVVAAAGYRFLTRLAMPVGVGVLVAVGVVAVYLNTTASLATVIDRSASPFELGTMLRNVAGLGLAAVLAPVGRRAGDRLGTAALSMAGARELDLDVERMVATVGRNVTVTLPEQVHDMPEHDPVRPETKETLAGKTLVFPRRLTVVALRERLVTRLRDDYGVSHVDVDLAEDGTVEYLAVGSRPAGLGPTLPPGSVAVAIHADPAQAASPGDRVQVWRPGGGADAESEQSGQSQSEQSGQPTQLERAGQPAKRVATGELRGRAGDVVTLALDGDAAADLDDETRYRLLTLPAERRPELAFASVLRAADETLGIATVGPGSDLAGTPVGALDVTVVAVRPPDGGVEAIPARSHVLAAGETVYAVGRPDALRSLQTAAGDGGSGSSATGSPATGATVADSGSNGGP